MRNEKSIYIVILAGGGGTRLWPKSRQASPKQFLPLFDHKTLLQITYERAQDLVNEENILIVTSGNFKKVVQEQLPDLKQENILVEPAAAGTAAAAGLAAVYIRERDPDAVISTLASDHYIKEKEQFLASLRASQQAASKGEYIVTLGLKPSFPHTGLGYIQAGKKVFQIGQEPVFEVVDFTEKPDQKTATNYLSSGDYFWNANINSYQAKTILEAFETFTPALASGLGEIQQELGKAEEETTIKKVWQKLKPEPIDTAVLEKAKNVLVIPANFTWLDIGDWSVLYDLLSSNKKENIILGEGENQVVHLSTKGTLVYPSHRLIGLIGLQDLVVIDTPDALLICDKKRAQDVKKIVEELRIRSHDDYL